MIERDYPIDFLQKTSKKLLSSLRGLIEENIPYRIMRTELEKEYFDPLHSARRFERSQMPGAHNASSGVILSATSGSIERQNNNITGGQETE